MSGAMFTESVRIGCSFPACRGGSAKCQTYLNDYVCSNGLENDKQSAYKLDHSTETALLSIKNDVHVALARGEVTAVVLLDQSSQVLPF